MKSFILSLRRQKGFTLVELMVVVAIIGLLSAVAVPNFKKYQAKSKMSEAKLQLSAAYTAETSFFSDFNIYHSCLGYMGYDPSAEENQRYYAVGFINATPAINATAFASAVNSGLQSTATECPNVVTTADTGNTFFRAGKSIGSSAAATANFLQLSALGDQATTNSMTFTISAGGVIEGNRATADTASLLTIDNTKRVQVRRNGY
jgi:type IV pilus assembly protein PilA